DPDGTGDLRRERSAARRLCRPLPPRSLYLPAQPRTAARRAPHLVVERGNGRAETHPAQAPAAGSVLSLGLARTIGREGRLVRRVDTDGRTAGGNLRLEEDLEVFLLQ